MARSTADGRTWPLTADGAPARQYGAGPESTGNATLLRKVGLPHLPPAAAWSPDSTKVLAHRTDERGVRQTHLVEARPADGGEPRLHTQRYARPGDEHLSQAELVVLDVAMGSVVRAQAAPLAMPQADLSRLPQTSLGRPRAFAASRTIRFPAAGSQILCSAGSR
ncbi:DPP IV N-terminal domain-containing protein [Kitasatospora sp. NBC_01560]|uniref:DPP IV N-terminal domain-containing protein n=1 Tax=Kitasatospora sp. NBC_01560 TaxID=2975965 RepID=UPI00387011B9